MKIAHCVVAMLVLGLGACASIPRATIEYSLPKADIRIEAERAYECGPTASGRKTPVLIATTASATPVYSADPNAIYSLNPASLDRWYTSADIDMDILPDGRLVSIGSAVSGDAAQWAKVAGTAVALGLEMYPAAIVLGGSQALGSVGEQIAVNAMIAPPSDVETQRASALDKLCHGLADKSVRTLKYTGWIRWDQLKSEPRSVSSGALEGAEHGELYQAADIVFGELTATADREELRGLRVDADACAGTCSEVRLMARRAYSYQVQLHANTNQSGKPLAVLSIPAPTTAFSVPMIAPGAFGKRAANVAFHQDGTIAKLKYGGDGGASMSETGAAVSQALAAGVMTEHDLAVRESTRRAARLRGEADVVAAEARLAACRSTPLSCK